MVNITALKAEFTQKTIEGRIKGLACKLYKLAANPQAPHQRGPLFISLDNAFKPAAEYDGMLGSMMLDSFLGTAFADAGNDNTSSGMFEIGGTQEMDFSGEAASEYLKDHEKQARGQGSFARTEHKSLCNQFSTMQECDSFAANHAVRLQIEETLAALSRTLGVAKRNTHTVHILEFCT
ncbi:MAG: hypothetical protein H6860_04050 [Rhodospirillales bacterium]|nr:hypothetical protein [Rhodospirillales bacterium]